MAANPEIPPQLLALGIPVLGLACRSCGCRHFYVIYTRRAAGGKLVRRRECRHCGKRITTVEEEKEHGTSK